MIGGGNVEVKSFCILFSIFPYEQPRKFSSMFVGLLGALTGLSIWLEYLMNDHAGGMAGQKFVWYTILLIPPSLMALISSLLNKKLWMYIAFLLCMSVTMMNDYSYFAYFPLACFFLSIVEGYPKPLTRMEKRDLERLITEQVEKIVQETEGQINEVQIEMEKLVDIDDSLNFSTPEIASIYQINLITAYKIKDNYERYIDTNGLPFANTYRLGIFYVLARTNGIWDLKQTLGEETVYKFKGNEKTGEYIGNHHYGYMGKAIGLSSRIVRLAAGIYQVYSGTSKWKYAFSYFDDPKDSKAITDGCTDYDSDSLTGHYIRNSL